MGCTQDPKNFWHSFHEPAKGAKAKVDLSIPLDELVDSTNRTSQWPLQHFRIQWVMGYEHVTQILTKKGEEAQFPVNIYQCIVVAIPFL